MTPIADLHDIDRLRGIVDCVRDAVIALPNPIVALGTGQEAASGGRGSWANFAIFSMSLCRSLRYPILLRSSATDGLIVSL